MFKAKNLLIVFACIFLQYTSLQAQLIQLISTDELRYEGSISSKICKGNVKVLHGGVYITCDSAIINDKLNTMEGVGNVYIYQPDTFDMYGKKVFYDGKTKMARVSGDVVLKDKQMVLTTPYIDYDTQNKTGTYSSGGTIVSANDNLTSVKGYYNSRTRMASFRENVVLVNPDYTMKGDTLQYSTATQTAYFYGPTVIQSETNRIECIWGYYNTNTNLASFSKRATIFGETSVITADSFFYNRNSGNGEAFGNIVMRDTIEEVKVYGQLGLYQEKIRKTMVTGLPMSEKLMENDTMLLLADTFYYYSDTLNKRLEAFRHAKIYSKEMSGICDTLIYYMKDSMILMLNEPILWNIKNQITGDTITVFMKNKQVDYMYVRKNGFVASWQEADLFDQMAGNEIYNYFEASKLKQVHVIGQGQSIYYSRENDTGAYSGVNKIECGEIKINLDSAGISDIRFFPKPEPDGILYPPLDFPTEQKKLPGLNWQSHLMPEEEEFFERKSQVNKE